MAPAWGEGSDARKRWEPSAPGGACPRLGPVGGKAEEKQPGKQAHKQRTNKGCACDGERKGPLSSGPGVLRAGSSSSSHICPGQAPQPPVTLRPRGLGPSPGPSRSQAQGKPPHVPQTLTRSGRALPGWRLLLTSSSFCSSRLPPSLPSPWKTQTQAVDPGLKQGELFSPCGGEGGGKILFIEHLLRAGPSAKPFHLAEEEPKLSTVKWLSCLRRHFPSSTQSTPQDSVMVEPGQKRGKATMNEEAASTQ